MAIWSYHEIRRGDPLERRQVFRAPRLYVFPVIIEIIGRLFAHSKSSFGLSLGYAIALSIKRGSQLFQPSTTKTSRRSQKYFVNFGSKTGDRRGRFPERDLSG